MIRVYEEINLKPGEYQVQEHKIVMRHPEPTSNQVFGHARGELAKCHADVVDYLVKRQVDYGEKFAPNLIQIIMIAHSK